MLRKFTWFKPQAACSCFVMGFKYKPTFYMRTIPNIFTHLKQLDEVITTDFIQQYWVGQIVHTTTPQQLISRTRSINLANHLVNKRRRLQYDQATLLGPSANEIQ